MFLSTVIDDMTFSPVSSKMIKLTVKKPIKKRNNPKFELMKQRLLELLQRLCKNPRKECFALTNTLAKMLGRSRRQIFRYLKALIEEGKIKTRTIIIESTRISYKTFRFISLGASKMFKQINLLDLKPISEDPYILRKLPAAIQIPQEVNAEAEKQAQLKAEQIRQEAEKQAQLKAQYDAAMAEEKKKEILEKELERLDNIRQYRYGCLPKEMSDQEAFDYLTKIYGPFDIKDMREPPTFWPDSFKRSYLETGDIENAIQQSQVSSENCSLESEGN